MNARRLLPLLLLLPLAARADTLQIPIGAQGAGHDLLPQHGQSKRSVLERFGLADEEHPAVGKPPITRWDYREFSVYFEYDHVLDSVRHHQPRTATPSKEQP
ncbi:phosphodiesterase [Phytopseudomonas dryadis]|uniref:Phosphodiesterase n=1 Tax=Phytopseudomonas dryadis TaxID=2487520 RepID=A0A4Q9R3P6_9GAMM|nr:MULTISPECIES: phosphodiesterase [Pseudomonas]TBU93361.1 phosphodiesterase [Pseudomonas dryadis]TBV07131.1 phosphodiesterase [Pseudomonas dryadis]TBV19475.1 phosphodiesterase [Pseudomonas sp. FRB 230]